MKQASNTTDEIYRIAQIENKALRDLAAILYSVDLQHSAIPKSSAYTLESDSLDKLKQDYDFLKEENIRQLPLGKYAERLLLQYFKQKEELAIKAHNIQLIEGKKTIGEIDYILEDTVNNELIHLEFAIKYYLKNGASSDADYLGPNAKDRFALKLNKLLNHQCQLTINFNHLLPNNLKNRSFNCKHLIKGCLFYPFDEWSKMEKEFLSVGWWIRQEEISNIQNSMKMYSIIESRSDWIFPLFPQQKVIDFEKVVDFIGSLQSTTAFMLVRKDNRTNEVDRGFIVPDEWPN